MLRGYDNDHGAYLFVEVDDPGCGRRLLRELAPHVTPSTPWVVPPAVTHNVAFTHAGLGRLGMGEAQLASFPVAFREGMAHPQRASRLGDEGPAAPARWEPGLRDDTSHLVIMLSAWRGDRLDARVAEVADRIDGDDGLRLAHRHDHGDHVLPGFDAAPHDQRPRHDTGPGELAWCSKLGG